MPVCEIIYIKSAKGWDVARPEQEWEIEARRIEPASAAGDVPAVLRLRVGGAVEGLQPEHQVPVNALGVAFGWRY